MDAALSSLQNPRVKQVIHLRERRERDKSGLFLIEGYREILRAVDARQPIQTIFICPQLFLGTNEEALIQRLVAGRAAVVSCTEKVFQKMSYRDRPDGLIAIGKQQSRSLVDLEKPFSEGKIPFFVVAEAIEKPGNLGTILRSSDAVGIDGLIWSATAAADIYNPNVVRASVGTLFTVPVVRSGRGRDVCGGLRREGVAIVAATPAAEAEFTDVDLTGGPVAIAVGTEQLGLSERWMSRADVQVRIPMLGVADSLNVAMATTLLLYEVLRQRRKGS